MQARRGRYFQICRWEQENSGQVAADGAPVRACVESDGPRILRLKKDPCKDKPGAAAAARATRRARVLDAETVLDPRSGKARD